MKLRWLNFCGALLILVQGAHAAERLKIISIVTDDQASWSIGAYGNRESRTPNMDRLAREGVLFLNAFVATPVCSPSRASFLTGLYGTQVGITDYLAPREQDAGLGLPSQTTGVPDELFRHDVDARTGAGHHGSDVPLLQRRAGMAGRVPDRQRHVGKCAVRQPAGRPVFSPDGTRIAVTVDPRPSQIWVYDVARRTGHRLATKGHNLAPLWSLDGMRVFYASRGDIYWRPADGATPEQRLFEMARPQYPDAWTRDGRLVFSHDHEVTRHDVWMMSRAGDRQPLVTTHAHEPHPRLSPDERWLAYSSDESGPFEVHVRPFPNIKDGKWIVSAGGGAMPTWSRDGRELFYMNGPALMSVAVDTRGGTFRAGTPKVLFTGPFETGSPNFDVSPDGRSFLMVEADPDAKPTQIQVILNWSRDLQRLIAAPREP